jgi:Tfp pilus assembly protein PilZ
MRAFIRHPLDIPIQVQASDRITRAVQRLKDVSIGGLCYQSEVLLEVGLLVNVVIPAVKPPFAATGRVVWCQPDGSSFNVGIQFIEARDVFKVRMVEQICHIEHYKNQVLLEEGRLLTGEQAALEWDDQQAAAAATPKS